jgi:hypothetical protein
LYVRGLELSQVVIADETVDAIAFEIRHAPG